MEGRRLGAVRFQTTDSEKDFTKVIDLDVYDLQPLVARPHNLSLVSAARELRDIKVDEDVLGTCINSSLDDLR